MKTKIKKFTAFCFFTTILTSCNNSKQELKQEDNSTNNTSVDCAGNTVSELESCYQSKSVNELATLYCEWAEKEAKAKELKNKGEEDIADNHTDAIQRCSRKLSKEDKDKFRDLTKDCKEHN